MQQAFPDGAPGYLKWYVPLDLGDPETGETPYGFRMDQLFTPLQTLDLAAMFTYWGTGGNLALPWGSNEEGMASMLGPLAGTRSLLLLTAVVTMVLITLIENVLSVVNNYVTTKLDQSARLRSANQRLSQ